ncbi:unnamed protein product, partial [Iphiclides podalirius]
MPLLAEAPPRSIKSVRRLCFINPLGSEARSRRLVKAPARRCLRSLSAKKAFIIKMTPVSGRRVVGTYDLAPSTLPIRATVGTRRAWGARFTIEPCPTY